MSAHTPTPWNQDGNDIECWIGRSRFYIAECESEEDAARIVQCVNEHDGLIEQIESLRAERDGLVAKNKEQSELIERMESEVVRCQVSETDKVFEIDGLVEALRKIKDSAMMPDSVLNLVEQTLAKYEK